MTSGNADILVVEDDQEIRYCLSELLEEEGYQVRSVANGQEALAYLRAAHQPPRLILLDLAMPVMDGWQFRSEQKRDPALAKIPVVVVAAASKRGTQVADVEAEAFVPKPLDLDHFLDTIKQCAGNA
jgi:CheY-like chemotaxis protein